MRNLGLMDPAFLGGLGLQDPDAAAYITAVEGADGQALETGVRDAINAFVLGCKADGIWNAIKASCILAGARTLAGALVPLVGAAPTNFNFVAGDYSRTTGLVGNGNTKYLGTNRNNNADPQNNNHNAVYVTTSPDYGASVIMGVGPTTGELGVNNIGRAGDFTFVRNRTNFFQNIPIPLSLVGTSRSTSASYTSRSNSSNATHSFVSQLPYDELISIFGSGTTATFKSNARIAFYSIGESLNLALLDARVTALVNALAVAIP